MSRKKLIKSEVLKIFNTTKETLRHYENLGLIHPEIDENNYRYYDHNDLRKLRQIFFLREIEIPLEKIKKLSSQQGTHDEYLQILDYHYHNLIEKIERQKDNLQTTKKMLALLREDSLSTIFSVQTMEKRSYLALETPQTEEPMDSKSYYDLFINLVEKDVYTERSFLMIYPYEDLADPAPISGIQCLELKKSLGYPQDSLEIFPKAKYLSVFYLYRDHKTNDLISLYYEIEQYMKEKRLRRIGSKVIEMEHPELSIVFDENTNIYELQFQVLDDV